jgi:hypothetical protein
MRKFFMTGAATAILLITATIAPPPAQAMTLAVPAGLGEAIHETNLAQDVAYVCRGGWRWRRCWWTPAYTYYYRPYTYYPYSYYRPYRPWWGWGYRRRWWW